MKARSAEVSDRLEYKTSHLRPPCRGRHVLLVAEEIEGCAGLPQWDALEERNVVKIIYALYRADARRGAAASRYGLFGTTTSRHRLVEVRTRRCALYGRVKVRTIRSGRVEAWSLRHGRTEVGRIAARTRQGADASRY